MVPLLAERQLVGGQLDEDQGVRVVRCRTSVIGKIGVVLSSDGTLVDRWVHAAAMPRERAGRIAAYIRAEGDEAKVVPFGPKPQRRRRQ
jgi:hypothetical protein